MRNTLGNAKDQDSGLAAVVNYSPSDPRFTALLNRATQNLVMTGEKFWGMYDEFQLCVDNGCITLNRQIANVEAVDVCGRPIPIRGAFFPYLESGPGGGQCGHFCGGLQWTQKAGNFCSYRDILGLNKKIKVYADVTESAGAVITLMGYDENGQWIRTQVSGAWIDGEQVAISTTPQTSAKFFTALVAVQKPQTNGTVRLYEYDTTLLTQRDIAVYEPDETNPAYRRVELKGLPSPGCCGETDCAETKVTVIAKLEFLPVRRDTDWLLIGNFDALESEMQSIMNRRANLPSESMVSHMRAVTILRNELRHYIGSGVVQPLKMISRRLGGASVPNAI